VLLGLSGRCALIFALIWLLIAFVSRYSSLAALTAAVLVPIALYMIDMPKAAGLLALMSVIVFVRHRANISRLLAGTESRIGSKG
jgi:glycerol-3-phosphate acyltransferase PlsY